MASVLSKEANESGPTRANAVLSNNSPYQTTTIETENNFRVCHFNANSLLPCNFFTSSVSLRLSMTLSLYRDSVLRLANGVETRKCLNIFFCEVKLMYIPLIFFELFYRPPHDPFLAG